MMSMASESASTPCPGVRFSPPLAAIASQNAGAEAEFDPPAAEDVQAGDAPRQHHRRPQRQVGDVRRHAHGGRLRRDDRQERPRVQELGLVRVVLEGDEVQPDDVGQASQLKHRWRLVGGRFDEDPELEVVAIVGQAVILTRRRARRTRRSRQ
jgi:hypothetical protein